MTFGPVAAPSHELLLMLPSFFSLHLTSDYTYTTGLKKGIENKYHHVFRVLLSVLVTPLIKRIKSVLKEKKIQVTPLLAFLLEHLEYVMTVVDHSHIQLKCFTLSQQKTRA